MPAFPNLPTWKTEISAIAINSLLDIAAGYDAVVLDQWGVLHDGSRPYPQAMACVEKLAGLRIQLAVLSNSGKRAEPNARRIASMGFDRGRFQTIMTSGEALWQDLQARRITQKRYFAIERAPGDAARWAAGLDIELTDEHAAEAVLLMGLPDGASPERWQDTLERACGRGLPLYCSNPDRASPRPDGNVISPGALGYAYRALGGETVFYGKPHKPVFDAVEVALGVGRLLMVGDSLDHDIAGGHSAGWDTLLVQNGLYARDFAHGDPDSTLVRLCAAHHAPAPDFRIEELK